MDTCNHNNSFTFHLQHARLLSGATMGNRAIKSLNRETSGEKSVWDGPELGGEFVRDFVRARLPVAIQQYLYVFVCKGN